MVGSRFVELFKDKFKLTSTDEKTLDITDGPAVEKYFTENKYDAVVNLAAYTNVGEGEKDRGNKEGLVWKLNVNGAENVALACAKNNIFLVHISTDMIFPGNADDPGPYDEDHSLSMDSSKVTWYGFTKAEGERVVTKAVGDRTCILRLIYPFRAHFEGKLDYLRKPIQLYEEEKLYPLFTDQVLTTLFIDDGCAILSQILEKGTTGILHASCRDTASPYDHVLYALKKLKGDAVYIKTGSIAEFLKTAESPVRYPQFGGLKTEKTQEKLGMKFRTWREMIDDFVGQIKV